MLVKEELTKLGLHYTYVELGETEITDAISSDVMEQLRVALLKSGLEVMDDRKSILIQRIKNVVIELIHYSEEPLIVNFSEFLSQKEFNRSESRFSS